MSEDVKIKTLVWVQFTDREGDLSAATVTGEYVIRPGKKGGPHFRLWTPGISYNEAQRFGTTLTAKAAAQADYETRILSALEPVPAPSGVDALDLKYDDDDMEIATSSAFQDGYEHGLKSALTPLTQEPEPVGWRVEHGGGATFWNVESNALSNAKATGGVVTPLFATSIKAEPATGRVPEGWKLVPVEPTDIQAEAGQEAHNDRRPEEFLSDISAAEIYRAMLSACRKRWGGDGRHGRASGRRHG